MVCFSAVYQLLSCRICFKALTDTVPTLTGVDVDSVAAEAVAAQQRLPVSPCWDEANSVVQHNHSSLYVSDDSRPKLQWNGIDHSTTTIECNLD